MGHTWKRLVEWVDGMMRSETDHQVDQCASCGMVRYTSDGQEGPLATKFWWRGGETSIVDPRGCG